MLTRPLTRKDLYQFPVPVMVTAFGHGIPVGTEGELAKNENGDIYFVTADRTEQMPLGDSRPSDLFEVIFNQPSTEDYEFSSYEDGPLVSTRDPRRKCQTCDGVGEIWDGSYECEDCNGRGWTPHFVG